MNNTEGYQATLDYAQQADRTDPLHKYRKRFYFPQHNGTDTIYLCGNSLGLLSDNVQGSIEQELQDWKKFAIDGYRKATYPWMYYQHFFKPSLSRIMGCSEDEVTVSNALTVNLHFLMFSFYRPQGKRCKVMMEAGAFPSDQYAVETQVRHHGLQPADAIIEIAPRAGEKTLRTEDILEAIRLHADSLALVLFGGINYYTGQLFDLSAITQAAHQAGALAGFDLAHVAGNVPMQLHDWNVDFAAWCSYKYLNGGPGSVAGLFVHERYGSDPLHPRLAGWWGNDEKTRFRMEKGFVPQPGAGGWNISTAQVFNMAPLKAALEIIDEAGIHNLRAKSIRLTGYLQFLLYELSNIRFEIITPEDPAQRGAQLSLFFPDRAKQLHQQMIDQGIVVDYREPGVVRVAPAPLYNSFEDVYRFYERLKSLNQDLQDYRDRGR
ncbi:MAG: kynureninase [Williamsia sp.]|nr:kynureninase [Williamsia sp.]